MDSLHGENQLQQYFMKSGSRRNLLREISQACYTKPGVENSIFILPCFYYTVTFLIGM